MTNANPITTQVAPKAKKGLAIASLVLGALGSFIALCFIWTLAILNTDQPTSGTTEAVGSQVINLVVLSIGLLITAPLTVLSLIFSIISLTKSQGKTKVIAGVGLGLGILSAVLSLVLIGQV